jgi:hypothetical protein
MITIFANFLRKIGVFLKDQCYETIFLQSSAVFWFKNANFLPIFWASVFIIITYVPAFTRASRIFFCPCQSIYIIKYPILQLNLHRYIWWNLSSYVQYAFTHVNSVKCTTPLYSFGFQPCSASLPSQQQQRDSVPKIYASGLPDFLTQYTKTEKYIPN